jgi:hypothetical protein
MDIEMQNSNIVTAENVLRRPLQSDIRLSISHSNIIQHEYGTEYLTTICPRDLFSQPASETATCRELTLGEQPEKGSSLSLPEKTNH